jgi:PAS domain S-box-containing protein
MEETTDLPTQDVLDALPMAVVLIDAAGRVSGWSAAAEILYGHASADVMGVAAVEVMFDEDDRKEASDRFAEAAAGTTWEGDCRVQRRDGALLVSSFRAAPVGTTGTVTWVATDRTDQGLAEQERSVLMSAEHAARSMAEEALGLIEAILTSAPVGIAVFDLDLRYVRVNDAYAALSGVPAADHVGGRLGDVVPLQTDLAADLRRVVTTGRTILGRHVEWGNHADPSENRHFNVSYFPVHSTSGARMGAGLSLVEITESKRSEVERAALLRRAEAAQQRLSILATASTVLTTTMELDELLTRLTRVLTPTAADWCVIELLNGDGMVDGVAVSHRDRTASAHVADVLRDVQVITDGQTPIADVFRTGQARLLTVDRIDDLFGTPFGRRDRAGFSLSTASIVPIEARGEVLGVLILATEPGRHLDDDDLDLAVEVAHRAALAVGNARAFQQEHQIAETLQRALLPPMVAAVAGLDLAVRYVAATDGASVGGDWYDVLSYGGDTTGVVVGDVVGHDIAASTSMGQLRSALRTCAYEESMAPAAALARVDRLYDRLGLTYATCVFGVINTQALTFRWSNAGHPPPLILRDGAVRFLTDGASVLLGVTAGADIREAHTDLRDGDMLILYTDGLVERRGESLQDGLNRLALAVTRIDIESAENACDAVLEAMAPPGGARDDDVAVLVARIGGAAAVHDVHRLPFDRRAESAALTRGFTAGALHGAGWSANVDTAVLLVSELVTNAIRHATGPYALVVTFREGEVELAVEDTDPGRPDPRQPDPLSESGRGLLLVDALATAWGVRTFPGGKVTWFTLTDSPT